MQKILDWFGLIRKRDLVDALERLKLEYDKITREPSRDKEWLYYECGNMNAVNFISYKLGIKLRPVYELKEKENA